MFSPLYLKGHSCGLRVSSTWRLLFALACRKRVRLLTPLDRAKEKEDNNTEGVRAQGNSERKREREGSGGISRAGGTDLARERMEIAKMSAIGERL